MKADNFLIEELVPKELLEVLHEDILWKLIDSKLIESIETIKRKFPEGTMTINNYKWGGSRNWSGVRTKSSPYYSPTSQHSLGKAVDAVFSAYDVNEVRQYIITHPEEFPHIKGIELGVSWLHIDVRNSVTVKTFYP